MQKMVLKGCAVPDMVESPNWHRRLSKTCDNPFAEQGFLVSVLARNRRERQKTPIREFAYLSSLSESKTFETVPVQHLLMAGTKLSSQRQLDMSTVTAIMHEARVRIE